MLWSYSVERLRENSGKSDVERQANTVSFEHGPRLGRFKCCSKFAQNLVKRKVRHL
jgi:hypothetical protein